MNEHGFISNIGINLLRAILPIIEILEKEEATIPNEVKTSSEENGFSCAISVLSAILLESVILRTSYIRDEIIDKHPVDYFRSVTKQDELSAEIDEVFAIRDVIVHNHHWEADIRWGDKGQLLFSSEPRLVGSFHRRKRLRRVMVADTRQSHQLGINLFPSRIWRRDAYIVFSKVIEALQTLELLDHNYYSISNTHYHFNDRLASMPEILIALDIPDDINNRNQ